MNRFIRISVCLILVLTMSLSGQDNIKLEENKAKIAVLELDNNGVTDSEIKALTDRLNIEIVRHNKYDLMERQKMNSVLKEMEFQLSDCTSDECAIEIGQMIGVEKMVAGSVSKVGEYYTVSTRIIDVETGRIELTGIVDMEGTIGQVLTKAIPSVAKQLCQIEEPGYDTAVNQKNVGYIKIGSSPEQASVFVNNRLIGITPITVELEPKVENMIRVAKTNYAPWQKIYVVDASEVVEINVRMTREVVEPEPIEEEETKEVDISAQIMNRVFRLSYINAASVDGLNNHVTGIGDYIDYFIATTDGLYNDYPVEILSFQGFELTSGQRFGKMFFLDFSIGILLSMLEESDTDKWDEESDISVDYYLPYVSLDTRFYPMPDGILNPYAIAGIGYNYMLLDVKLNDEAQSGASYQSLAIKLGLGLDLRFSRKFGIGVEYDFINTSMELTEAGDDYLDFENAGLKQIDLESGFLKVQLNFYSHR